MTALYHKHYDDAEAADYARATHRGEEALVTRALQRVPRAESLLDLPCGAGRMTLLLARLGFTRLAAADVSPAMVELARRRFASERVAAALALADAERLPFADREYDNVLCFRLFHHFPTAELRDAVATELCRVAGRRVIVSYLDPRSFTSRKRALTRLFRPQPPSRFMQTPSEAAALFERPGFRVTADLARLPFWHSLRVLVAERGAV